MRSKSFNFYHLLLCLVLAFNAVLNASASGHNLSALNALSDDDVLIICTGTGTKWIDSKVYFSTGKIVEVEAPKQFNSEQIQSACLSFHAFDSKPVSFDSSLSFKLPFSTIHSNIVADHSLSISNPFFVRPRLRAPPAFLIS
uniref:hypothetical protein n=1 Tax=Ningiella ruwaisensis TaxID=2364274 RepID=UPI00109FBE08|nr:hypothetical protein [Ningiella ruwaisensis]